MQRSPFNLKNDEDYLLWRDKKLRNYPEKVEELLVEIDDPRNLKKAESLAIIERCRKTNLALYASNSGSDPDPEIPFSIGRHFGVSILNKNFLSEENSLTSLKCHEKGIKQHYIPYTNKTINWHTDGYYNSPREQVQSMMLHAVQGAAEGGVTGLMDHEIAYIKLRDKNPEHIRALMKYDVLTIPPRKDEKDRILRKSEFGPVFSVTASGKLHMRFTIRKKNIIWKPDGQTISAISALKQILKEDSKYIFKIKLESGMGLVSNNILHTRSSFIDDSKHVRHFYRSRYFERIKGT